MTPDDIRAIRMSHGLSQRMLALALDLSIRTIQQWEQGRAEPGAEPLKKLKAMQDQRALKHGDELRRLRAIESIKHAADQAEQDHHPGTAASLRLLASTYE